MGRGGIEVTRGKIRITFRYRGRRFKESTGLPATKANLQHARRLAAEIAARIAAGVFDFAAYFPNSPHAAAARAPDPTFRAHGAGADLGCANDAIGDLGRRDAIAGELLRTHRSVLDDPALDLGCHTMPTSGVRWVFGSCGGAVARRFSVSS